MKRFLNVFCGVLLVSAGCSEDIHVSYFPPDDVEEPEDIDGDGFTVAAGDCDDDNAAIHPEAEEHCDGVDEDCDGHIDNDPVDGLMGYPDEDGDGFGWDELTVYCESSDGFVDDNTDCDDTDPTVYPGSHEPEVPYDGIDQDCDGDDFCHDLNCDGYPDMIGSGTVGGQEGNLFYYGSETGFSETRVDIFEFTNHGNSLTNDFNGDGYLDVVLLPNDHKQTVRVYYGSGLGYSDVDSEILSVTHVSDGAIHDFDNDGFDDILLCPAYNRGTTGKTNKWVYWGDSSGFSDSRTTALSGNNSWNCSVRDFDQDGHMDLFFVGRQAPSEIFWGNSTRSFSAGPAFSHGEAYGGHAIGDFNGDGHTDMVIGVTWASTSHVWYGTGSGAFEPGPTFDTVSVKDMRVEDFDGDGLDDVAICGSGGHVFYGDLSGLSETLSVALPSGQCWFMDIGDADNDGDLDVLFPGMDRVHLYYHEDGTFDAGHVDEFTGLSTVYRAFLADVVGYDGYDEVVAYNRYDTTQIFHTSATGFTGDWHEVNTDLTYLAPSIVGE